MENSNDKYALNEDLWRAWVDKGRQREKAAARKARVVFSLALLILSLGIGFYVLTVR
jgi:hypothetical protein